MNKVLLIDFDVDTLYAVNKVLDARIAKIRETKFDHRTKDEHKEVDTLLGFQTQILYTISLHHREERVLNS